MSPEILTAIRVILIAAGGLVIGKWGIDALTWESIVTSVVVIIAALGTAGTAGWAIWAKRPQSGEAQQIAQNIIEDPTVPNPLRPDGKQVR